MKKTFSCYASAAFGLEGLVSDELNDLGMKNIRAENGGVRFDSSSEELLICNLKLHFCERVYIIAAEAVCTTFEHLFQLVSSVPWAEFASGTEAFNISAKCARSKLMSPRDCQSITKKALIEKLKVSLNRSDFPEKGSPLPVQVSVHSDLVKILINTSGEALSKRGYRTWNGEAPLRESLAAALIRLSPWKPPMPICDPCCGTGTILIESALMASCRAPGLRRKFAMENFYCFRNDNFGRIRHQVSEEFHPELIPSVRGSDISPEAVNLAERHIRQAGMEKYIQIHTLPLQNLEISETGGVFICNPPYGERLSDLKSCRKLYRDLHTLKDQNETWSMCILSSDPAFERFFGKKADRKRRLYNGRLECAYYIYYSSVIQKKL